MELVGLLVTLVKEPGYFTTACRDGILEIETASRNAQIAIRAYGSATSGAVTDPTINAIDRFFDLVDGGVEKIDHALNRGKSTEGQHRSRRQKREVIDASSAEVKGDAPAKDQAPSASALVRRPRFYVVESITPSGTIFVVTDGGNARTECSSREFAEKILRALEAAP